MFVFMIPIATGKKIIIKEKVNPLSYPTVGISNYYLWIQKIHNKEIQEINAFRYPVTYQEQEIIGAVTNGRNEFLNSIKELVDVKKLSYQKLLSQLDHYLILK